MEVELLHHTPLEIVSFAIRECYDSHNKSDSSEGCIGDKDFKLIDTVGNVRKHSSTLEHLNFNFRVKGISRLLLQEFCRHRISSFSVKSSRFTLNELKKEESFMPVCEKNIRRASEFIVFPENGQLSSIEDFDFLMENQMEQLEMLRVAIHRGIKRDVAKYLLPECYKVNLAWTVNLRSLQNFLTLRSSKHAHFEIRELAGKVFESLPSKCKELCKQCMEVKGE